MITHYGNANPVPLPRPGYLIPVQETAYNSQILRLCNNAGVDIPTVGGSWHGVWSRHRYSKRQPWNSDMTRLLIDQKVGGVPSRLVLDCSGSPPTYAPLWGAIGGAAGSPARKLAGVIEAQWRPSYPTHMVTTRLDAASKTIKIEVWDVNTGATIGSIMSVSYAASASYVTSGVFPETTDLGWTGEGQISDDGRWTALCTRLDAPQLNPNLHDYLVVVDLEECVVGVRTDIAYATNAYPSGSRGLIGNVGISCLGNYVEVKLSGADPDVGTGYAAQPSFILDVDKNNFHIDPCIIHEMDEQSLRMGTAAARGAEGATLGLIPWMSHPTMNLDSLGQEVVVGASRVWENSNWLAYSATGSPSDPGTEYGHLIMVYPATGRHIHVSPGRRHIGDKPANVQHVSGMAYQRRGWEYITTEMGSVGRWAAGEIQAIKLTANLAVTAPRSIERYCLHRSDERKIAEGGGAYNSEAHAAPSPNGLQIAFASNWCGIGASPPSPQGVLDNKGYIVRPAGTPPPPPPPPDPEPIDPPITVTTGPFEVFAFDADYAIRDGRNGQLIHPSDCVEMMNELFVLQGGVIHDTPESYVSLSPPTFGFASAIVGSNDTVVVTNTGDAELEIEWNNTNQEYIDVSPVSATIAVGGSEVFTFTVAAIPVPPGAVTVTYVSNSLSNPEGTIDGTIISA